MGNGADPETTEGPSGMPWVDGAFVANGPGNRAMPRASPKRVAGVVEGMV